MGEIVCRHCNTMYSHLDFHDNTITICKVCNCPLGDFCETCMSYVCPSCHLYCHYKEPPTYYKPYFLTKILIKFIAWLYKLARL